MNQRDLDGMILKIGMEKVEPIWDDATEAYTSTYWKSLDSGFEENVAKRYAMLEFDVVFLNGVQNAI